MFGTAIYSVVPKALKQFRTDDSKTDASLLSMTKGEQIEAIMSGRYFPEVPEIETKELGREQMFVAVPDGDGRTAQISIPLMADEGGRHPCVAP